MKKILTVYKQLSLYRLQVHLQSKLNFWPLSIGKFIRMVFVIVFYLALYRYVDTLAGYTLAQMVLFFAVYNMIDVLAQALFTRGIWNLQDDVKQGTLDHILTKPIHPLLLITGREIDWMDITTTLPAVGLLLYSLTLNNIALISYKTIVFVFLIIFGILLLFAINILMASITFFMVESVQLWYVYNELTKVGKYPPQIFDRVWQIVLTYVVPVFIIFYLPVKFILEGLNIFSMIGFALFVLLGLFISFKVWDKSILHYTSASS